MPKVSKKYRKNFFVHSVKILNLLIKELRVIAKMRGIKGYKSLSEDELLTTLNLSKTNFSEARIQKIRKEFNESRHKFSKSKINEIRKNFL